MPPPHTHTHTAPSLPHLCVGEGAVAGGERQSRRARHVRRRHGSASLNALRVDWGAEVCVCMLERRRGGGKARRLSAQHEESKGDQTLCAPSSLAPRGRGGSRLRRRQQPRSIPLLLLPALPRALAPQQHGCLPHGATRYRQHSRNTAPCSCDRSRWKVSGCRAPPPGRTWLHSCCEREQERAGGVSRNDGAAAERGEREWGESTAWRG